MFVRGGKFIPFLIQAAWVTLEISVLSIILGLILGLLAALMKISKIRPLVWLVDFYLWVIRGTPVLVVTHEMTFAREVADRVVYMHNGLIEEQGDPKVVLTDPKSDRLKAFLRIIK
ncbi:ABC transporter permease subunit [Ammoniphilus sp. 3BR4]|uniref:ABC transporter permease subunit n=1 Tax=Ammoniphilus sp. 3BR4 TaxID=3158265 RepID=UPI003466676B